jgi:hypothetical protein
MYNFQGSTPVRLASYFCLHLEVKNDIGYHMKQLIRLSLFLINICVVCLIAVLLPQPTHAQLPLLDWVHTVGSMDDDQYSVVELTDQGDVYAAGQHMLTVDLDPGPGIQLAPDFGMFIQKFDSTGNLLWAYPISCPSFSNQLIYDMAIDGNGNLLVVGRFHPYTDFDAGPGTFYLPVTGPTDMFLLKLSSAGGLVYAKVAGRGGGLELPYAVGVDSLNNVVIAGIAYGSMDYLPGNGNLYLFTNYYDGFVVKFDSSGFPLWGFVLGGSDVDEVNGIQVAPNGTITVVGKFANTADFDPGNGTVQHTASGTNDGYLAQYSSMGTLNWVKLLSGGGTMYPLSVACDNTGNFIVSGGFGGELDLDTGPTSLPVTSSGSKDIFLMKTNAVGDFLWGHRIGGSGVQFALMVACDDLGDLYLVGQTNGQVDFDPGPGSAIVNTPDYQLCYTKFDSGGQFQWVGTMGGSGVDESFQIAVSAPDQFYAVGHFEGTSDFAMGPQVANDTAVFDEDGFLFHTVACIPKAGALTDTICSPFTLNGQTFTSTGIYTQSLHTSQGCDSILTLDLTFQPLNPIVTVLPQNLLASPAGGSYQWLDCNMGMMPISGANSAIYTPSAPGSFAVIVDLGYCVDSSACVSFPLVSIAQPQAVRLSLFPNPAQNTARLILSGQPQTQIQIRFTDVTGRLLTLNDVVLNDQGGCALDLSLAGLSAGIYLLHIQHEGCSTVRKLVKE